LTTKELSLRYSIDVKTSEKWRDRDFQVDVALFLYSNALNHLLEFRSLNKLYLVSNYSKL
jgi:hypothetical protein